MKTNNIRSLVTAAASALLLSQCATNSALTLKSGEAYLNASPASEHRGELTGLRVVSVNGKKTRGSATRVPIGPVKVVVAFHWPKIGEKEVPLSFHARDGHTYFVKYDCYPHLGFPRRGGSGVSKRLIHTAGWLAKADVPGVILAFPVVGAAVITGFVEHVGQGLGFKPRSRQAANFIDLSVISTLSSEGVVKKVRSYPPGSTSKR